MASRARKHAVLLALLSAGLALATVVHALVAAGIDPLALRIALVLVAVLLAGAAGAVLSMAVRAHHGKPDRS